jgi:hypothetical protein
VGISRLILQENGKVLRRPENSARQLNKSCSYSF